jgi:acyl-CoA thioester hydrolase
MEVTPTVYDFPIDVNESHIDALGHVNNVVYVQWVQDTATAHWTSAATQEQIAGLAWVVLRHEIDYLKPAFAGDRLVARTWVGEDKGVRYERFVEIVRPADDAVLVKARSQWCALDKTTMRPKRVDPAVRARFVEKIEGA